MRAARLVVAGWLLVVGASHTMRAQQPIFRAETRLIVETVTVKDKEGRAIEADLEREYRSYLYDYAM